LLNRIGSKTEHDRGRIDCSFGCTDRRAAAESHYHTRPTADQIGGQIRQVRIVVRPANLDRQVLAFDIAGIFQLLAKSREIPGGGCSICSNPIAGISLWLGGQGQQHDEESCEHASHRHFPVRQSPRATIEYLQSRKMKTKTLSLVVYANGLLLARSRSVGKCVPTYHRADAAIQNVIDLPVAA